VNEPWEGGNFPLWGPPPPCFKWGPGFFPGGGGGGGVVKCSGPGGEQTLPSSADMKERVELFLHSPSGPSRPVLR